MLLKPNIPGAQGHVSLAQATFRDPVFDPPSVRELYPDLGGSVVVKRTNSILLLVE